MHKTIISDTSCFIILNKIGELSLLKKLYDEITTTVEIATEFGEPMPEWVNVVEVQEKDKQRLLELQLDKGESSAIALALEMKNSLLILDDIKARKVAAQLGLSFTGTLGIIIKAKLQGIITSVIPILNKIKQTDFRLTSEIEIQVLKEAKEF
jgi:predicted nucleic acid-binding protein